jgi:hypothetical protein
LKSDNEPKMKGYKPILKAVVHANMAFSFVNDSQMAAKLIINREQRHGGCQHVEELTTHAFLSHKRSSAQGDENFASSQKCRNCW